MPPQTLAMNGVPAGACRCSKVVSLAVEDCGSWLGGVLFVAVFFDEFACCVAEFKLVGHGGAPKTMKTPLCGGAWWLVLVLLCWCD